MSDYSTIELDISPAGVAVVVLNRPDNDNALNAHVVDELRDVFSALSKSTNVRAVILRGAGDTLSSGEDREWLKASLNYSEHELFEDALSLGEMLRELNEMPHPTIVLVQGRVSGPAVGLVAAADAAISLSSATFVFSETARGCVPAAMAPFIINAVGPRRAKLLFMTAGELSASDAREIGLIEYIAANETELDDRLETLTADLFKVAKPTSIDAKSLVDDVYGMEIDHALVKMGAKRAAHRRASSIGREGVQAIVEGRKPDWSS